MSDYSPTTEDDFIGPTLEEIRDAHIEEEKLSARDADLNRLIWNQAIAYHDEQVAKANEQRIIKLLEEAPKANPKDYSDEDIWAFQKAIALIKDKVSA